MAFYNSTGYFLAGVSGWLRCKIVRHIMNYNCMADNVRNFKSVGYK